jgi:hypothetical protein
MFYSIHASGVLVSGLGILWLVLASKRLGANLGHAFVLLLVCIAFAVPIFLTWDKGFRIDYPGPLVAPFVLLPSVLLFPFWMLPPFFPKLAFRSERRTDNGPKKILSPDSWKALELHHRILCLAMAGLLFLAWFLLAQIASQGFDTREGFQNPRQFMAGAVLPLFLATAGLLVLFAMDMGQQARKLLFWFIASIGITTFLFTLAVIVVGLFLLGPGSGNVVQPLLILMVLHAAWIALFVSLLNPVFGIRLQRA